MYIKELSDTQAVQNFQYRDQDFQGWFRVGELFAKRRGS